MIEGRPGLEIQMGRQLREMVFLVLLSIAAAVVYGVAHDQVTARICVEYFSVAHPPVFATDSPTLLGIGWGVFATWWMGVLLGVPIAVASRAGREPRLRTSDMLKPIGVLLGVMAAAAVVCGVAGYVLGEAQVLQLQRGLKERIDPSRHARFFAAAGAHLASYAVGGVGGVLLVGGVAGWRLGVRRCAAPA